MSESANDLDRHQAIIASAGFQKRSLIRDPLVGSILALERTAPLPKPKHLAFRMIVVLERV
jgi:hypothetical protein